MEDKIDPKRKELYEKSAECLGLFIETIPNASERQFYASQIFKKIDPCLHDYLNKIQQLIDGLGKDIETCKSKNPDLYNELDKLLDKKLNY